MKKKIILGLLAIIIFLNIMISLVFAANASIEVINLDYNGAVISVKSDEKINRVIMYKKDSQGNYVRFFENMETGYNEKNFFISRYSLSETDKSNFRVDVITESGRTSTEDVEVDKVPELPEPKENNSDNSEDEYYDDEEDSSDFPIESSSVNLNNSSLPDSANKVKPTSIALNTTSLTLTIGEKKQAQLKLTIQPSNAKTTLTWSTEDKKIATVDKNGIVKGKKTGATTIRVKTDNGLVAQCRVTVKLKKIRGTISKKNSSALLKVNAVNGCTAAESMTITDKYYIFNKIKNNSKLGAVSVYDINTKKRVNALTGEFGHANGATYVAEDNSIYIAHMGSKKVTKITTNKLTSKKLKRSIVNFPTNITALDYDSYTRQWILRNSNKITIYSKDLKTKKRSFTVPCHIHQDCISYKGLLLSIDFVKKTEAYIYVYNINTKECYGKYKVTIPNELESLAYDQKNDRFVMFFNDSVGDTVYTTKAINLKNYY